MHKFFNTAGPVNKEKHYKLDPLTRFDLNEVELLIEQEKYFIMHAPRQTGERFPEVFPKEFGELD